MRVKPRGSGALLPALAVLASPAFSAVDDPARVAETYAKVPLQFEANRGQADEAARFLAHGVGYGLYLTPKEAVLVLAKPSDKASDEPSEAVALRMSVVGARATAAVSGVNELPGKANYFIGNDPSQWHTNVPTYAKVRYSGVYPGIDLVYYGQQRQLEYDFVVAPGADPDQIALGFHGANGLEIDAQGDLVLHTAAGDVRQHKPVVYQETDGIRRDIEGGYVRKSPTRVGFKLAAYDHSRPLVIDPVLMYSTFLGGSVGDGLGQIAVDADGNVYVTGATASTDFPTTPGAPHGSAAPSAKPSFAFVTKVNSTGSAVLYSATFGGSGSNSGGGLVIDSDRNVYVSGVTQASNFPTTPGAFQTSPPSGNQSAVYAMKLDATGSKLVFSTYVASSGQDTGGAIAIDAGRNVYLAGGTSARDFPTTPGVFQASAPASQVASGFFITGFVAKLNPSGSALVYSTFLGGPNSHAQGIAVDAIGEAFVHGFTTAASPFPTTPGAFQTTPPNIREFTYVTKLNTLGSALVYSTLLGGSTGIDLPGRIAVDASGHAYVTGDAGSTDFPITPGAAFQKCGGGFDAYVTKFDASGSSLVYSTCLGGAGRTEGHDIAVDADGDAFVTGFTGAPDFPVTPDAYQSGFQGGGDAFVTMLDPTGSKVVYSTFIGGSSLDSGNSIAVDTGGTAYVSGSTIGTSPVLLTLKETSEACDVQGTQGTICTDDFPTTPGVFQPKFGGGSSDGFIVKIAEPILPTTSTGSSATGSTDTGSAPTPPPASAPVADAGSSKSGGGAIDWLTLPALLAAAALARRRRAER